MLFLIVPERQKKKRGDVVPELGQKRVNVADVDPFLAQLRAAFPHSQETRADCVLRGEEPMQIIALKTRNGGVKTHLPRPPAVYITGTSSFNELLMNIFSIPARDTGPAGHE